MTTYKDATLAQLAAIAYDTGIAVQEADTLAEYRIANAADEIAVAAFKAREKELRLAAQAEANAWDPAQWAAFSAAVAEGCKQGANGRHGRR